MPINHTTCTFKLIIEKCVTLFVVTVTGLADFICNKKSFILLKFIMSTERFSEFN